MDVVKIDGFMNAERKRLLFVHHAVLFEKGLIGNRLIFQYGNVPKHCQCN